MLSAPWLPSAARTIACRPADVACRILLFPSMQIHFQTHTLRRKNEHLSSSITHLCEPVPIGTISRRGFCSAGIREI